MNTTVRAAAVVVASALVSLPATAQIEISKLDPSVVLIEGRAVQAGRGVVGAWLGTGFVINDSGHVATNHHIMAPRAFTGRPEVSIELVVFDGGTDAARRRPATPVWSSKDKDLAVIVVEGLRRPALTLASGEMEKGSKVFALGFPGAANFPRSDAPPPGALSSSLTDGIVSRGVKDTWPGGWEPLLILQHTALITSGNSGGPLLDACGRVVGVNTLGIDAKVGNIYFASHVSALIEGLKSSNLRFAAGIGPCTGASRWPQSSLVAAAVAVLLSALALVVAFRRPRQQLSKLVRNAGHSIRQLASSSHRAADPVSPAVSAWLLSGFDASGRVVRFNFDRRALERAPRGMTIGRDPRVAGLVIDDDSISRCHARLWLEGEKLLLEDLASSAGSTVNERAAKAFAAVPLELGSRVKLGSVRVELNRGGQNTGGRTA